MKPYPLMIRLVLGNRRQFQTFRKVALNKLPDQEPPDLKVVQ